MTDFINPYGTKWHDKLVDHPCLQCGTYGDKDVVVSFYGDSDVHGFCSSKCFLKYAQTYYWEREER